MSRIGLAVVLAVLAVGCAGSASSSGAQPDQGDLPVSSSEPPATGDGVAGSTGTGEILCPEPAVDPGAEPAAPAGCEEPDQLGKGQTVQPVPGVVDPRPVNWELAEPAPTGAQLVVTWVGGVQECYGLDRVEVTETETEVRITVYEGALESAASRSCIDLGVVKQTNVQLSAPLGDRTLVDGSE